jgi:hypothetical protein
MNSFLWLIKNQFKESKRSIMWQRNVATNIFFGIILSLLMLNLLSVGLLINKIFDTLFPDQDHIQIFNSWLIYYFLIDLVLRYFLQKDPGLGLKPYLNLPVKRSNLIHFLLFRSATSFLNLLPLFLILPFALNVILPNQGLASAVSWLAAIICFILSNSFLSFYIRRRIAITPSIIFIFIAAIAGIFASDYFDLLPLSTYSGLFYSMFNQHVISLLIPMILSVLIYRVNYQFFKQNLYQDKISIKKERTESFGNNFSYLENFGETGEYIVLELKMLLRNKRTKSSFMIAVMMLVVGPFFYITMSPFFHPYPEPGPYQEVVNENEMKVIFKIYPDTIPDNASVYICGDHKRLGEWARGYRFIPLERNGDGSWQRMISFPQGTSLRFKFTLGTWKNQRTNADGSIPEDFRHTVKNDTTLIYQATGWRDPPKFIFADLMMIYMGLTLVGILMLIYGQFMLAWESNYFDFLLSRKINFTKYFEAKYIILVVLGIVMFLLTVPLVFIAKELLYINAILAVYFIGVNSFVMLIVSGFTRKKLDLNASIFSSQGKGANQFTLIIPTIIVPVILFLPFALLDLAIWGYVFLLVLGLSGLILYRPLLRFCLKFIDSQKYKITAGFKQN